MSGIEAGGATAGAGEVQAAPRWRTAWLAKHGAMTPAMVAAVALVLGVLLMPVVFFRFQRDQAHFAYLALGWLNGLRPYADVHSHQFPGQLLVYALVFKVLGVSEIAIRLVDLVLQVGAGLALAALVSRFTRPLTGAVVAILFAIQYVCLEPWNTANRETFQIALLLPIVCWISSPGRRPWLDRVAAFVAGGVSMLVLLIKPTVGLVLVPLAWALVAPGGADVARGLWRRRWPFLALGMGALAVSCAFLFFPQRAAVFESLWTYNVEVYSKVSAAGSVRIRLLGLLLFEGLYLVPFVFLIGAGSERPRLLRMAAIHAGLVAATLVQGKGFSYQVWLAFPLCLFWTGLFLDGVVARVWASRGEGERRPSWLAAAAIVFLAIGLPAGNGDLFKSYGVMLADPGRTQGNLAPLWDQTVTWLRANVGARERVFFFGHDPGVSFLMRLPPVTRTVALDLQDDKVNAHPLMAGRKQRMMEELAQAPPDWILVATYDGSWLTKNGIESLKANRPLLAFLHDRYERVPSTQTAYWVFHRQPTEARIPAASPMGSPGP